MQKNNTSYGIFFLFLFLLVSCRYDPHARNLTTAMPDVSDVVGSYIFEESFLPNNLRADHVKTLLTLYADGTFVGEMVPTMESASLPSNFFSSLKTISGKWNISPTGSIGTFNKQIWGVSFLASESQPLAASFLGKPKPNGMIFQFGDPDSGYAIILKRK